MFFMRGQAMAQTVDLLAQFRLYNDHSTRTTGYAVPVQSRPPVKIALQDPSARQDLKTASTKGYWKPLP